MKCSYVDMSNGLDMWIIRDGSGFRNRRHDVNLSVDNSCLLVFLKFQKKKWPIEEEEENSNCIQFR